MVRRRISLLVLLAWVSMGLLLSAQAIAEEDSQVYLLGSEDVITVTVLRHPEFSGDFLIPATGVVEFPVVGNVTVSGTTATDLSKLLATRLKVRLVKPEVTVIVKSPRMQRMYVLGQVQHPGVFDLKPGWSFAEAISSAGGILPSLQSRDVVVILQSASTKDKRTMPLDEALSLAGASRISLRPGDVLQIDTVELAPVYVSGKVKSPGLYQLRADSLNVLGAIAQAGGATDDASLANVRIVRADGKEEVVDLSPALVKGEKANLPKVARGDMVIVPEQLNRFAVLGYVSKPGYYPIPSGHTYTLADAVALASGADKRGRITKIGVARIENGKEIRKVYDLNKFLRKGDTSQNPAIAPGDLVYVPETDHAEMTSILSALSSTALFFNAFRR